MASLRESSIGATKERARSLKESKRKRDFAKTPEPQGGKPKGPERLFVVQKHRASALHYDFRLEAGGVLVSWAVPKGPSLDPKDKRLAMAVEDHPLGYARFEGVIPEGEYGGGTVMVWDIGTYRLEGDETFDEALRKGRVVVTLNGKKLKGSWTLVRTADRRWLLMKRRDRSAAAVDITTAKPRSVLTRRLLAGIARGKVVMSGRPPPGIPGVRSLIGRGPQGQAPWWGSGPMKPIRPMLATLSPTIVEGPEWVFEEKYDGIRAVTGRERGRVKIWSRTLQDLTQGFPHVVEAVGALAGGDLVLDGELVALDAKGVSRFQLLQRRGAAGASPTRYAVFDLLILDGRSLMKRPLVERRRSLERAIGRRTDPLFISRRMVRDGKAAYRAAKRLGWEGILAKDEGSPYEPGVRSRYWRKVKVRKESEFVIGGYTPPKGGRRHLGALLVGLYDGPRLRYVGKVGTGFREETLEMLSQKLARLRTDNSPFDPPPPTRDATWVRPKLVAQLVYAEWTADGKLRQPAFLGLRTDKDPSECTWSTRER